MVSKSNVIETNSRCICGNGDTVNSVKNYFENKCPACGKEGALQLETESNVEVDNNSYDSTSNNNSNSSNITNLNYKITCKSCGEEYCAQDGYDRQDSGRPSLTTVNPYEVTDDEDSEASSTDENETTYMSGWEGLCDLLKPLDGQAMMIQRGDIVLVKKIDMPQSAKLWAYEGINVVDDSVSITDYTPEIYNTFIIKWGENFENELEFTIDNHKKLFGERKVVIEAKKISVVDEDADENNNNTNTDTNTNNNENTNESSSSSSVEDMISKYKSGNVDTSDIDANSQVLGNDTESDTSSDSENVPKTEEIPITTKDEAVQFGLTEVGKAKRDDGHTIELKVIGNSRWQVGEWCHVRLPSFNEDCYMFVSKCSFESSPDSEYINTLTLVDYPPSLGKPDKKSTDEEEDSEDSDSSNPDTDANSDKNTGDNTGGDTDDNTNKDDNSTK